ncbi:MAG: MBL fold metallo-hydrolase [Desulfovibrio sp.]|jgi:glyoxylase-like metal-dependent hydrolase (beta-lactamase superfamily II)|nr:MBL fold metallo-hydrolase [Desulfovibrio sp.]
MPTFSYNGAFVLPVCFRRRGAFATVLPSVSSCFRLFAFLLFFGQVPLVEAAEAGDVVPQTFRIGAITVTALLDRHINMDIGLFSGPATPEERQKYMPEGKAPASINVFLIQAEGKNILVDTGSGTVFPGSSQLDRCLSQLGLAPDNIDLVLLTHMHSDHIGGLLKHKKRVFPKAQVMVSKPELDYWTSLPKKDAGSANAALVKVVLAEYGRDILPPFALGAALLPGISSVDASGHTPGHSVFLVESEGRRLLILGDLLHAAALQFPLPDECADFDMDAQAAIKARKDVLAVAAAKDIPVAGMHIPFSGVGKVMVKDKGFDFTPLP